MRTHWVVLFATLLVGAPLAGCFGAEEIPNERKVSASGGKASPGWAYDGVGVTPAGATLEGSFLNAENTGTVAVSFDYAGSAWQVTFDQFGGAKDFMDGGIAFDLAEHGDTGVADASIPQILARVAAWGTATVTRDGVPVTGAAGDRWAAHLMVSDTTVRNADGKILKADGSASYDPAAPGDATRVEGDPQALLKLVHPDGETAARAPAPVSETLTFMGGESTQAVEVAAEPGAARLVLNATPSAGSNPVGVGDFTIRVLDAAGTEIANGAGGIGPQGAQAAAIDVPLAAVAGPLQVSITGEGAFSVALEGAVSYDDHPLIVLTWDDLVLE